MKSRSSKLLIMTSGVLSLKIINAILQLVTVLLLVRLFSIEQFGKYALVMSVCQVILVFAQWGFHQVVLREATNATSLKKPEIISSVKRWANRCITYNIILWAFIGLISIHYFEWPKISETQFILGLSFTFILVRINIQTSQLRGMGVGVKSQIPLLFICPAIFVIGILVAWMFRQEVIVSVESILSVRLLSVFFGSIVGFLILRKILSERLLEKDATIQKSSGTSQVSLLNSSLLLGISGGVHVLNSNLDIFYVSHFLGDKSVAFYRVATISSCLIFMIGSSVKTTLAPIIVERIKARQFGDLELIISEHIKAIFWFVFLGLAILVLFGRFALGTFYGKEFLFCYWPMMILCFGHVINIMFGPAGIILNHSKNEKLGILAGVIAILSNLILNFFLVEKYGLIGASFATLVSSFIFNVILAYFAKKYSQVNCFRWMVGFREN